jgi:hypothetical protein
MASPSQSTEPDNEDDARATYAGAKRRIAALEQQLQDLRNAGGKRRAYVPLNISHYAKPDTSATEISPPMLRKAALSVV